MTLPALASFDAVVTRLGRAPEDPGQVEVMLNYASALIRAHCHDLFVDELGVLTELPDGVPEVCTEMVYRGLTNPAGVTQDTAGPFSTSFGADAAQRVWLTKGDKEILGGQGGAFTIDTTPALATDFSVLDYWVETSE